MLVAERPEDGPFVHGLIARAFGPGRFAKTAERLREGTRPILSLSFVAWRDDVAVGCVRQWRVSVGDTPALLLGPFAVEASDRRHGVGAMLIRRACEAARSADHRLIVLVGNEHFFGPLGFAAGPARLVRLPGPVDQRRVLVQWLAGAPAEPVSGQVRSLPA